mmetsp:Transcript_19188/g.60062  ORF Transcript_19188/g.60062 Transcript_19188/m.60062 type:complete len:267 (+) Transcript_19188:202-1002(+)
MQGNATDGSPDAIAASSESRYALARRRASAGVGAAVVTCGPVTWRTASLGRWKAGVRMGWAPAQSEFFRVAIAAAHASRSRGPAARWTRLSTQTWSGRKQPSPPSLAAFTIAPTRRVRMSPRQTRTRAPRMETAVASRSSAGWRPGAARGASHASTAVSVSSVRRPAGAWMSVSLRMAEASSSSSGRGAPRLRSSQTRRKACLAGVAGGDSAPGITRRRAAPWRIRRNIDRRPRACPWAPVRRVGRDASRPTQGQVKGSKRARLAR